jgi:hypothetical protein
MLRQISNTSSLEDEGNSPMTVSDTSPTLSSSSASTSVNRSYKRRSSWSNLVKTMQERGNKIGIDGGSFHENDSDHNSSQRDDEMKHSRSTSLDRRVNSTINFANTIRLRMISNRRPLHHENGMDGCNDMDSSERISESVNIVSSSSIIVKPPLSMSDFNAETISSTSDVDTTRGVTESNNKEQTEGNQEKAGWQVDVVDAKHNNSRNISRSQNLSEPYNEMENDETIEYIDTESSIIKYDMESTKPRIVEAFELWLASLNELKLCPEMGAFLRSSCFVASCSLDLAIHTVTLPVVVPYKISTSTVMFILSASIPVITESTELITNLIVGKPSAGESTDSYSDNHPMTTMVRSLVDIPVTLCWTLPISVVGIATNVTCNIVSTTLSAIGVHHNNKDDTHDCEDLVLRESYIEEEIQSPKNPTQTMRTTTGQSSSEEQLQVSPSTNTLDFLDRLRLDDIRHRRSSIRVNDETKRVHLPDDLENDIKSKKENNENCKTEKHPFVQKLQFEPIKLSIKPIVETSVHLLRVNDIELVDEKNCNIAVSYLDLSSDCINDRALLKTTLNRLIVRGLSMLANHPPARLSCKTYTTSPVTEIKWNPIGSSTKNVLGRLSHMTNTLDRLHLLQKEILIWSGDYVVQKGYENYGRNFSMYLARGIIPLSPLDIMHLMWDDSRTKEYNEYSNGRSTEISIENADTLLQKNSCESPSKIVTTGTKAIRSETRVPLTKFTIETKCLMHVRALDAPDDGYVILSRSLDQGDGGTHYCCGCNGGVNNASKNKNVEKCDNQILWGINVLKCVPNHPHLTDLISLSHVSTPNVPGFFGRRIAIMGIEDFFNNVRKVSSHSSASGN